LREPSESATAIRTVIQLVALTRASSASKKSPNVTLRIWSKRKVRTSKNTYYIPTSTLINLPISTATGYFDVLPGANPVQASCYEEYTATSTPAIISPTYVYTRAKESPTSPVATATPSFVNTEVTQDATGECLRTGTAIGVHIPGFKWCIPLAVIIFLEYF
jgi:hypothetical protein